MTFLLFVSLFLAVYLVVDQLLLVPVHLLFALQFPHWFSVSVIVLLLAWLLGDE
jgi:hypothetical protein